MTRPFPAPRPGGGSRCAACGTGWQIGSAHDQCVKAVGTTLVIIDHTEMSSVTIKDPDVIKLYGCLILADLERDLP